MKYVVQSPAESEVDPSSSVRSAFEVMMVARKVVRLPTAMEGTLSKKDELYNHVRACVARKAGAWMHVRRSGFFRESIYKRVDRRVLVY